MRILIVNGPNLNLLGRREPSVYGTLSFEDYFVQLQTQFPQVELSCFQSNHEGELIDTLHNSGYSADGIILNAGAYTHTSIALHDAIKAIEAPVIEVHISNVYARETFRRTSYISPVCQGSIVGLGLDGYRLAVEHLIVSKQPNL